MRILNKLLPLIGILLFVYIISKINIGGIFKILKEINIPIFLISIVIYMFYIFVRVLKWNYIMKKEGITYKFVDSLLMYLVGTCLGLVTPGRIGDFSKVFYLKNDGHSIKKALVTVFLDRLSDLFFLFLFGYLAMFIFYKFFSKEISIMSILIVVTLIISLIVFIYKKTSKRIIEIVFNFFIPKRYKKKFVFSFSEFFEDLKSIKKKVLLNVFIITMVSWILVYICYYIAAMSLSIEIPFLYLAACASVSSILTLIPISISGIGTRDAILIMLFAPMGIGKETAIAFSAIELFFMVLFAFIGLVCWFKKPLQLSKTTS